MKQFSSTTFYEKYSDTIFLYWCFILGQLQFVFTVSIFLDKAPISQ